MASLNATAFRSGAQLPLVLLARACTRDANNSAATFEPARAGATVARLAALQRGASRMPALRLLPVG